jgi:hypothetical protein
MHSQFTISEIRDMLDRKDLIVNTTYQRSPNIWPPNAKSYFIDSILEGYPFPKVYFYETYDERRKKPRREIVDGQQRITTCIDFLNNVFALSSASKRYAGSTFNNLPDDDQKRFIMMPVQVDIVLLAERSELLEMFRRINAYTAPLNPAEKRHAEFQGKFKWFINELADQYSPSLEEFGILTSKQILRMGDAEFLTELAIVLDRGIVNKDQRSLNAIYKKFDVEFPQEAQYRERVSDFFEQLRSALNPLRETFMMRSYVIHSLFCALTQKKYGIPRGEETVGVPTGGSYFTNVEQTLNNLRQLADAHETQDTVGPYKEYVEACLSTTHRIAQRTARSRAIAQALA